MTPVSAVNAPDPNRHLMVRIAVLTAAYLTVGLLTLGPLPVGELRRIIWVPSGLAVAGLLLWGPRVWPGVAAGAFLTTLFTGGGLFFSLGTAAGNSLEPLAVYLLLRGIPGFDGSLERVRDVLALVVAGALASLAGAAVSVGALSLTVPVPELSRVFAMWWLTHALGIGVVAPFFLTVGARGRGTDRSLRSGEGFLVMGGLTGVGLAVFGDWVSRTAAQTPLDYTPFPLLIWASFRFGPRGAATANLLISGVAIWATVTGRGPFGAGDLMERLLLTGLFVGVVSVTTLLLAAVVVQGRRAEEARLKSESTYRMLVEQAADGIFITDSSGQLLDVNSSGLEMLGYARREALLMSVQDLFAPGDGEGLGDVVEALTRGRVVRTEWMLRRRDGSQLSVEVSAKRLADGRLQGLVRDVSERKALEDQLVQSQKMEAIGMLAGGVAHDFNNLLTAIMGHAQFAEESLPKDSPARADLEEVRKSALRAAELTRQLLAFARKQIVAPRVIVLDDLVENLEKLLTRLIGADIQLVTGSDGVPRRVRVDPVQLEQVILNLAINAREAMPRGGTVAIRTSGVAVGPGHRIPGVALGEYAVLSVRDTGVGMDDETRARIFEPFFTTKGRSKGTGLGLATSYGIIRQAGGHILVDSRPGEGSVFRILLPVTDLPVDGLLPLHSDEEKEESAGPTPAGTLLVVEDEAVVRDLAVKVLTERGYRVLQARDGEEALREVSRHPAPIDLAIIDIVLPLMGGRDVAERLRKDRPGLRVLFVSGYAEDEVVHDGEVEEGLDFLSKPFSPETLLRRVSSVLSDSQGQFPPGAADPSSARESWAPSGGGRS